MLRVILDPSKENEIQSGYVCVETEVDFLHQEESGNTPLWVRGENLCRWVSDICRVRGLAEGKHYKTISSPRLRLQRLLGAKAYELSSVMVSRVIARLNEYGDICLSELITRLTEDSFWTQPCSRTHAARWLLIHFDQEMLPLVEAQQERWAEDCSEPQLKSLYKMAVSEREGALRSWLLTVEASALGLFPFQVEGYATQILKEEWGKLLRSSCGAAIERLSPLNPNASHIAQAAYDYFIQHPEELTDELVTRISLHLPMPQRGQLEEATPKLCPPPLALEDKVRDVLTWAVDKYLPYRRWQVSTGSKEAEAKVAELSKSFAGWMLHNYPRLSMASRESSYLNVRVKYEIDRLLVEVPVLWVVVDGLNHVNHRRLLRLLSQTDATLEIEEDHVLLAILPTVTEHAKFSLTTGLFPGENATPRRHIKEIYTSTFAGGTYASARIGDLHTALSQEDFRLCYWNMMDVDECYHQQTDPSAAERNIEARLRALAQNISDLVLRSPHKDELAVVICTDHGQMIGHCVKSKSAQAAANAHGRTFYGDLPGDGESIVGEAYRKSLGDNLVTLNPTRFRLDAPVTIPLDNTYFGGWREDAQGRAWGVHGGLYPEEVVVGFTILKRKPVRLPVTAIIKGMGEALKPGAFSITVDNPNHAPIIQMMLVLEAVEECKHGLPIRDGIDAASCGTITVETISFPAPATGDTFEVKGTLIYEFEDGVSHECEVVGTLTSKQIYSTQRPLLRDRFKR
jgi:hypothetical protein